MKTYEYNSATGALSLDGVVVTHGYSGFAQARNDPSQESKRATGPIPRGMYMIGQPHFSDRVGRLAMHLTPVGHTAFNRTALMIHGDNTSGTASRGCVILDRVVREEIARAWKTAVDADGVLYLEVV